MAPVDYPSKRKDEDKEMAKKARVRVHDGQGNYFLMLPKTAGQFVANTPGASIGGPGLPAPEEQDLNLGRRREAARAGQVAVLTDPEDEDDATEGAEKPVSDGDPQGAPAVQDEDEKPQDGSGEGQGAGDPASDDNEKAQEPNDSMSRAELEALAQARGIDARQAPNKATIIEIIKAFDAENGGA